MSAISTSFIAFACIVGATLVGLFLQKILPADHLSNESKDTVKLGMGMVATLAALVLGLLIGFATNSYNQLRSEVQHSAADVILLDRAMAHYGAEAEGVRDLIRRSTTARIQTIWPEGRFEPLKVDNVAATAAAESVQEKLRELTPRTDAQRWLQSRALSLSADLAQTRWLLSAQADNTIPTPLLAVLIFWISAIFLSFALFAPRNATVLVTLFVCAFSVSGAIFLLLEINGPFDGVISISSAPLRDALVELGK